MTDTQIMTLTDSAAKRVKSLLGKASETPLGLRIGITNTGCNGLTYTMDYATDRDGLARRRAAIALHVRKSQRKRPLRLWLLLPRLGLQENQA